MAAAHGGRDQVTGRLLDVITETALSYLHSIGKTSTRRRYLRDCTGSAIVQWQEEALSRGFRRRG
jgi:hypothetical protein